MTPRLAQDQLPRFFIDDGHDNCLHSLFSFVVESPVEPVIQRSCIVLLSDYGYGLWAIGYGRLSIAILCTFSLKQLQTMHLESILNASSTISILCCFCFCFCFWCFAFDCLEIARNAKASVEICRCQHLSSLGASRSMIWYHNRL